jgi:hypothetical protein
LPVPQGSAAIEAAGDNKTAPTASAMREKRRGIKAARSKSIRQGR